MELDLKELRWLTGVLPQPVAVAVGRIARARRISEQRDAIQRTAEILTRYVAIAATASVAARSDVDEQPKLRPTDFLGPLAWGKFVALARASASVSEHPLAPVLAAGLGRKKSQRSGDGPAPGIQLLEELLQERNKVSGHSLMPLDDAKAESVLRETRLDSLLLGAIESFGPLLRLPLVVFAEQRMVKRTRRTCVLPFVGEVEPFPIEVELDGFVELDTPYIALGRSFIPLSPGMVYEYSVGSHARSLLFINEIGDAIIKYQSLNNDEPVRLDAERLDPLAWLAGEPVPPDELHGARTLQQVLQESVQPVDHRPAEPEPADEVLPESSGGPTPQDDERYRDRTLDELRAMARDRGLLEHLDAVLEATEAAGWNNRPRRHGVMVAPPSDARRYLLWIKLSDTKDPYLKISYGLSNLERYTALDSASISDIVSASTRRIYRQDSPAEIVSEIDRIRRADSA